MNGAKVQGLFEQLLIMSAWLRSILEGNIPTIMMDRRRKITCR